MLVSAPSCATYDEGRFVRTASTEIRVELRFAQEYFYFGVNWLIGSWPVPCLFIVAKVRYMYSSCTNHEISGTIKICFTVLVLMQASLSLCRMEVHASFLWLARDSCDHLQDSGMQPPRRAILVAFLGCGNNLQSRVVARQCANSPPYDINPIALLQENIASNY